MRQLYIRSNSLATSCIGVLLKRKLPFRQTAIVRSSRLLLYSPETVLISTCSLARRRIIASGKSIWTLPLSTSTDTTSSEE